MQLISFSRMNNFHSSKSLGTNQLFSQSGALHRTGFSNRLNRFIIVNGSWSGGWLPVYINGRMRYSVWFKNVFFSANYVSYVVCATGCVCLWFMFEYSWRIVFYCAWAQKATKCLLYALHTDSHSVQSKRIDQLHSIFWLIGLNTIEKLLVLVSCSFLSIYSRSFRPSLSDCHQKCTVIIMCNASTELKSVPFHSVTSAI